MLRTTGQQRTTGTRGVLRGPRGPKKYKGYRFQTSQFSTIVALLLKFQTFKSSEVKIGGSSKEKKFNLSSVNIVTGIFKHSNHLRLKIGDHGKLNILTFICDVLWIPVSCESRYWNFEK